MSLTARSTTLASLKKVCSGLPCTNSILAQQLQLQDVHQGMLC